MLNWLLFPNWLSFPNTLRTPAICFNNYGDVTYNRFASHDRLAVQFKYVNRSRFISPEDIMKSVISFILPT